MDSPLGPARRRLGITQAKMAARLKVSAQTISRWERNEQGPGFKQIPAIAAEYRLPEHEVAAWVAHLTRTYAPDEELTPPAWPGVHERLEQLERRVEELEREVESLRPSPDGPASH